MGHYETMTREELVRLLEERDRTEAPPGAFGASGPEDRYCRSIFQASITGMYLYNLQEDDRLVLVGANPAADRITGVANHSKIGMTIEEAFPPLAQTELPEAYRVVARQGGTWSKEQVDYDDGVISGAYEVLAFQIEPDTMVVMFDDITERKRTEEALRESKIFNEKLLNTSPDIIYIYDLIDRRNVYSNEGILQVLGYSVDEIQAMGENVLPNLMHPEDFQVYLEETFPRFQAAADNELIEHQYRLRHRDGSWLWIHSKEYIFKRDPDGDPWQIFGILADVTERKAWEEERENLIVQLRKALSHVKSLRGILPICTSCKKIRDDRGFWQQVEVYVREHTEAEFNPSLCLECAADQEQEEGEKLPR